MSQAARNYRDKIAAKRHKKTTLGVKIAGVIFFLLILAAIAGAIWQTIQWMSNNEQRPIAALSIGGERIFTTDDNIRQAILTLVPSATFVNQNVDLLQQELMQQMPWIKHVSIRKQWPDKLRVYIVEYQPVAYWNDQFLLDEQGHVFSAPLERNQTLPLLYGPKGEEKRVLNDYLLINQMLTEKGFILKVTELTARYSWRLVLNNDVKLELGRKDTVERIKRFLTLYPLLVEKTPENQRIDYIDLRYETGAAVGWAPNLVEITLDGAIADNFV